MRHPTVAPLFQGCLQNSAIFGKMPLINPAGFILNPKNMLCIQPWTLVIYQALLKLVVELYKIVILDMKTIDFQKMLTLYFEANKPRNSNLFSNLKYIDSCLCSNKAKSWNFSAIVDFILF